MIRALALLLFFQLAGEVTARALALPIAGPVVGMAYLWVALLIRKKVPEPLETTSHAILQHLSLLFVPAGVGVLAYAGLVRSQWLPIALTLLASTLLSVIATALVMRAFAGARRSPPEAAP